MNGAAKIPPSFQWKCSSVRPLANLLLSFKIHKLFRFLLQQQQREPDARKIALIYSLAEWMVFLTINFNQVTITIATESCKKNARHLCAISIYSFKRFGMKHKCQISDVLQR